MKKSRRIFLVIILVLLLAVLAVGIALNINKGATIGTLLGIEDEAYLADDNNSVYYDEDEQEVNDVITEEEIEEIGGITEDTSLEETGEAEEIEEFSVSYDEDEEIAYETDISIKDLENTPQTLADDHTLATDYSSGDDKMDEPLTLGSESADINYSFCLKGSTNTSIEFWAENGAKVGDVFSFTYSDNYYNVNNAIVPQKDSYSGNIGCWIYNCGYYNGDVDNPNQIVDVKCTFNWNPMYTDGEKVSDSSFSGAVNCLPLIGINQTSLSFFFFNRSYEIEFELYTREGNVEKELNNVNMSLTIADIDMYQYVGIYNSKINKIQCLDNCSVYMQKRGGYYWAYSGIGSNHDNLIQDTIRYELKNTHSFKVVFGQDYDSYGYSISEKFLDDDYSRLKNYSQYVDNMYDDVNSKNNLHMNDYGLSYVGVVNFDATAYGPYELFTPIKTVSDSNEEPTTWTVSTVGEDIIYDIYFFVPLESSRYYYESCVLTDVLPGGLEYVSSVIYKDNEENSTDTYWDYFEITSDGQEIKATARWQNNSNFYNSTYHWEITCRLKTVSNSDMIPDMSAMEEYRQGEGNWYFTFSNRVEVEVERNGTTENLYSDDVNTTFYTTGLTISKTWIDDGNSYKSRPTSITVDVYQDGSLYNNYEMTADNADKNNENKWTLSVEVPRTTTEASYNDYVNYYYTYTIGEENVSNYIAEIDGNNITNKIEQQYVKVPITKTWVDDGNSYKSRPTSITVQLYRDGEPYKTQDLKYSDYGDNNTWEYTFENLPKYDIGYDDETNQYVDKNDGHIFKYTVEETTVDDYTTLYEDDTGYDIMNKITQVFRDIDVIKTWDDCYDGVENKYNARPETIEINLYRDDASKPYRTATVSGDMNSNEWIYTFTNLPKYDIYYEGIEDEHVSDDGHIFKYWVEEVYQERLDYYETTYTDIEDYYDETYNFAVNNRYIGPILTDEKERDSEYDLEYVVYGEKIKYTITIENTGETDGHVTLTDNIPDGTTLVPGSITIDGVETTYDEKSLASGIEIVVPAITGDVAGKVVVTFEVTVDDSATEIINDATAEERYYSVTTNEVRIPVVRFEKEVVINRTTKNTQPFISDNAVTTNDELKYIIRVYNLGTEDVHDVVVKDTLPDGIVLKTINDGGTLNGYEITWVISEVKAETNEEVSFEVTVYYNEEAMTIRNVGTVDGKPTNETETPYEVPMPEVRNYIIKYRDGDGIVTDINKPITYQICYTAVIKDFIGKAEIVIVDYLPYEIDVSQSMLDGGIYNASEKTITWTRNYDVDTYYGKTNDVIQIEKNITLKYIYGDDYESLSDEIINEAYGQITITNKTVNMQRDAIDECNMDPVIPTTLIVHHYLYDEALGGYTEIKLADDETYDGTVGDWYQTSASSEVIENGYELIEENPENFEGYMKTTPIEVNYYYKLVDPDIVTNIEKDVVLVSGDGTLVGKDDDSMGKIVGKDDDESGMLVGKDEEDDDETGSGSGSIIGRNSFGSIDPSSLIQDGDEFVITNKDDKITYEIVYDVSISNYVGEVKITIADTLPAKIDLSKSDLGGGTYDEALNTITWEVILNVENELNTQIAKKVSLVYVDQDLDIDLVNNVTGTLETFYDDIFPEIEGNVRGIYEVEDDAVVSQYYKFDMPVVKVWDDNEDALEKRPDEVDVVLLANGIEIDNIILNDENSWGHIFYNLSKYDEMGEEITYTIEEQEVNEDDLLYYKDGIITYGTEYTEIKNSYLLDDTDIDATFTKEGLDVLYASGDNIPYKIYYSATITDYVGDVILTITDYLPYGIDEELSDLSEGTYNTNDNTITWEVDYGYIDTVLDGPFEIEFTKEVNVVYGEYLDASVEKIVNEANAKLSLYEDELTSEEVAEAETKVEIMGNVNVKYIDIDTGEEIAEEENLSGKVGLNYETQEKDIDGYIFIDVTSNATGIFKEELEEVTYYYQKSEVVDDTDEPVIEDEQEDETEDEMEDEEIEDDEVLEDETEDEQENEIVDDEELVDDEVQSNLSIEKEVESVTKKGITTEKNSKTVKVEVGRREADSTDITVQYKITVNNEGSFKETVTIIDYLPEYFTISSSNPEYWIQDADGDIVAEVELDPGESEALTVVLDWIGGEENLGKTVNRAVIAKAVNEEGYAEVDLEDNESEATALLAVRTGWDVLRDTLPTIIICGFLGIICGIFTKRVVMKA